MTMPLVLGGALGAVALAALFIGIVAYSRRVSDNHAKMRPLLGVAEDVDSIRHSQPVRGYTEK